MPAAETPVAYLGIDVGKSSHSACALDAGGGVAFRAELANRPDDIDRLLERAGSGALVVVDQKRNIGALVLARAHAHGNPCVDWQHLFGRFREGQPRLPELDRRHVAQRRVDPEVVVPVHVVRELGP